MSQDIFVLIEHREGQLSDSAYELTGAARALAEDTGGQAVAVILGEGAGELAGTLGAAHRVIVVEGPGVAEYSPTGYVSAIAPILADRTPVLTLLVNTAVGMDVGAGLSATLDLPLAAYAVGVSIADGQPVVTSQVYGGKMNAETAFRDGRGIATVIAGSFPADAGRVAGTPEVERTACAEKDPRIRFRRLIAPEGGDVDITAEDILVCVGRGIEDQDNIELAEELANALGGVVAASRPIVDAGWLPKNRQVGKSGLTVKPKLYLAVGLSGAPEHLEGMRDAELIVAINTDPAAPIFSVAHYGVTGDLFDILPELTERIESG